MNICGILLVRPGINPSEEMLRHEAIHTRQQLEMLILPFFIAYATEWVLRLIATRNPKRAYYQISFEREAYNNQDKRNYLNTRGIYSWMRYL